MKQFLFFFFLCLFASSLWSQNNLKKANKLFELGEYSMALPLYEKELEDNPGNIEALSRAGDCHRVRNNLEKAAEYYKKASSKWGFDPTIIFNYGKVLKSLGQYEEAKSWFLNYAEAYPGYGQHFAASCDFAVVLQKQPTNYEVKGEYINSVYTDFSPTFYKDKIVFASARTDILPDDRAQKKTKIDLGVENQLFISERDNNNFLKAPRFYHPSVQHDKNEGPITFSEDGKWVAYTKNNFVNGNRQIPAVGLELSLYIASVDERGVWGNPTPFPHNGSDFSTGFPCFADNGNTLYFASDRPNGYGGFDIFVSKRQGNTWSQPENLGGTINTSGNELSPYFDGYTMYFSSDWHHGLGGFDNFRVTYEDGRWSRVLNMGPGINSPADDFGLIYDAANNQGYFTSNRSGGKGQEDIYRYNLRTNAIAISVFDGTNNAPIPNAKIDFSACNEGVFETNETGKYNLNVMESLDCEVVVSKEGYSQASFSLDKGKNNGRRAIEIALYKSSMRYVGRVIDSKTNRAVSNVLVKSTNQSTGQKFELFTNAMGEYTLPLLPNNEYRIRYSKAGYQEISKIILLRENTPRNVLGSVGLIRSSTTLGGSSSIDDPSTPDGEFDIVGEDGKRPSTPNSRGQGYAVQVAALFKNSTTSMNKYQSLRSIGNLYTVNENNAQKVRIGIFETKAEAEAARRKIAAKGYSKAFVVRENINSKPKDVLWETSKTEGDKPKNESTAITNAGPYKVQLGAYRYPKNFNRGSVSHLGVVQERKKGNLTLILLAGYSSLSEAISIRDQARRAGHKGAYIVKDENGTLTPIR